MIASIRGQISAKTLNSLVIDVGGVGYAVSVSTQTLAELPGEGETVRLVTHLHVREDAMQLFGFVDVQERQTFESLISVSGVGPKLAMTILSGMPFTALIETIAGGNHGRLKSIPGVGKKTAERLIVELRERFSQFSTSKGSDEAEAHQYVEIIDALVNLGYKRNQAEKAVASVTQLAKSLRPEDLLREALSVIGDV